MWYEKIISIKKVQNISTTSFYNQTICHQVLRLHPQKSQSLRRFGNGHVPEGGHDRVQVRRRQRRLPNFLHKIPGQEARQQLFDERRRRIVHDIEIKGFN